MRVLYRVSYCVRWTVDVAGAKLAINRCVECGTGVLDLCISTSFFLLSTAHSVVSRNSQCIYGFEKIFTRALFMIYDLFEI